MHLRDRTIFHTPETLCIQASMRRISVIFFGSFKISTHLINVEYNLFVFIPFMEDRFVYHWLDPGSDHFNTVNTFRVFLIRLQVLFSTIFAFLLLAGKRQEYCYVQVCTSRIVSDLKLLHKIDNCRLHTPENKRDHRR